MTGERSPPDDVWERLRAAERELQRVFTVGCAPGERSAVCDEWRAAVHAWWAKRGEARDARDQQDA